MKITLKSLAERIDALEKQEVKEPEIVFSPVSNLDELVDEICFSIREHNDDWTDSGTTLDHKNGLKVWVSSSGSSYVRLYEPSFDGFNKAQKEKIWDAYKNHQPNRRWLYKIYKMLNHNK